MVDYNPKAWFSLITHSYSRHVMRTLQPVLFFMAAYSAVCCYLILDVFRLHEKDFHSTISMHSLLELCWVSSWCSGLIPLTTGGGRVESSGEAW